MGGAITEEEKKVFQEKLEKRLNQQQKRIERRMKKAVETGKRSKTVKTYDAEKTTKAFLNPQNRILFKEIIGAKP